MSLRRPGEAGWWEHLDVVLVVEQRSLHDVAQHESGRLDVEVVRGERGDAVPVAQLHRPVGHQLQQRTALVEVGDLLLQVEERLPVLKALRQLADPAGTGISQPEGREDKNWN